VSGTDLPAFSPSLLPNNLTPPSAIHTDIKADATEEELEQVRKANPWLDEL
jgi:hypothetical protein